MLEIFEMMTPLVMGYYLIYLVYRLGFIDEDEALTLEISSQLSDAEQARIGLGSFLNNS